MHDVAFMRLMELSSVFTDGIFGVHNFAEYTSSVHVKLRLLYHSSFFVLYVHEYLH